MMFGRLALLCVSLSCILGDTVVPEDQLQQFMLDVLEEGRALTLNKRRLPGIDIEYHNTFAGLPIDLAFVTKGVTVHGPSKLEELSASTGSVSPSGISVVHSKLYLGRLTLNINSVLIQFFNFKVEGSFSIVLDNADVDVVFRTYRNPVTSCQVTVALSPLSGHFYFLPGAEGGLMRLASYFLELALRILPERIFPLQWFLYSDLSSMLQGVLRQAATHAAC